MSGSGGGKVILLGEHAVVHGVPAIAAGLCDGATATTRDEQPAELHVEPWGVLARPGDGSALGAALDALLRARRADRLEDERAPRDGSIDATVALPGSAGLGSSAALAVAVLRALDARDGIARDTERSQQIALAWERVFHGNPSGIDTAMALAGGLARYVRSPAPGERALVPLPSARGLWLVVGHSGEPGSTREMVARVAERKSEPGWDTTLAEFADVVSQGEVAIERGELAALGRAFDRCHALLAAWGVSTPILDAMCAEARAAGALGAKLTGGGGGGCMIALVADEADAARVRKALQATGREAFETTIAASPGTIAASTETT